MLISDDHLEEQLSQLARELPLDLAEARPMTRCTVCNEALAPATRDEVWERVPPFVYLTHETYARCPDCGRIYWEGSHASRIRGRLARLGESVGIERGRP